MKNSLAVIAGLALLGSIAQSYATDNASIYLNNYGTSAGAIKTDTGLLPTDAWIEVLAGPVGGVQAVLGAKFNPLEPGFFDNQTVVIPGVAAGADASFTVRAWTGTASFGDALVKGSTTFTQKTGSWNDAATPPAPLTGPDLAMPSFTVTAVPEPSTIVLGALGAAALLIRRRK